MSRFLTVATSQLSLDRIDQNDSLIKRVQNLVDKALSQKASVLLLPEYFSLSQMIWSVKKPNFLDTLKNSQDFHNELIEQIHEIAKRKNITIIAGTMPNIEGEKITNRCHILFSNGQKLYQDKINMTRFEEEEWGISSGGDAIRFFEIDGFKCAVLTCYDVEFPQLVPTLAKNEVEILFCPSNTDDVHGYWRVRHCAQARCVELQCYAVMASAVGGDRRFSEIDSHHGASGIFTPCDRMFPEGGVLDEGEWDTEGVCVNTLDQELLVEVRKNGTVLNLIKQK